MSLSLSVDVCLKETMCVADSLCNLQMIREFCGSHLKSHCCLQLEDFLYAPPTLRVKPHPFSKMNLLNDFLLEKVCVLQCKYEIKNECLL